MAEDGDLDEEITRRVRWRHWTSVSRVLCDAIISLWVNKKVYKIVV